MTLISVDTDTPLTRSTKQRPFSKLNKERFNDGEVQDYYGTPEEYSLALLPYLDEIKEQVGARFNEPCDGEGGISNVLEENGWTGLKTDKFSKKKSVDMLKSFKPNGLTITNTPFHNKAAFLEVLVNSGAPFCALYPLKSMGQQGFSRQLNRLNTLAVIVLNKRFPFTTITGKPVGVEICAWYCGNFPEGYFDKSLYFAFSTEEGEDDDEFRPVIRDIDGKPWV